MDVPHHICLAFLNVDFGKLNSGPHAHIVSTFLSESSLHPMSTYGELPQG